jgi:hypothetical protein
VAHASAASLLRCWMAGSGESGELPCFFSLPLTKYMPDTPTSAGSAARRTYCLRAALHPGGGEEGDHVAHQDPRQRRALEML